MQCEQVHFNTVTVCNTADCVVCFYPKCGKAGHIQSRHKTWKKEEKRNQLSNGQEMITIPAVMNVELGGDCSWRNQLRCGAKSTERIEEMEYFKQSKRRKLDRNRYLKREEQDIFSEDDEEVNLLSTYTTETDFEEVCLEGRRGVCIFG